MRQFLAFLLLASLILSGCFGGKSSQEPAGGGTAQSAPATPTSSSPTPANSTKKGPDLGSCIQGDNNEPIYHPHNNWGELTDYTLFDGNVELLKTDSAEDVFRAANERTLDDRGRLIVGRKFFNPLSDGLNDIEDTFRTGKADTVWTGTAGLLVKVDWEDDLAQGLTGNPGHPQVAKGLSFHWKPANSADYAGKYDLVPGQQFPVILGKFQTDMAHNVQLSRWSFGLQAYLADTDQLPVPVKPSVAKVVAHVTITAVRGNADSIDPPHPFSFVNTTELYEGEINRTLSSSVVNVTAPRPNPAVPDLSLGGVPSDSTIKGWQVQHPYHIPWETTKVRVSFHYNFTSPAKDALALTTTLGLRYSDASGPDYKYPTPVQKGAGSAYYEIPIQGNEADDPYAVISGQGTLWNWGVYPITKDDNSLPGVVPESTIHVLIRAVGPDAAHCEAGE